MVHSLPNFQTRSGHLHVFDQLYFELFLSNCNLLYGKATLLYGKATLLYGKATLLYSKITFSIQKSCFTISKVQFDKDNSTVEKVNDHPYSKLLCADLII
jgi:hypothetical protein